MRATLLVLLLAAAASCSARKAPPQPLPFNHQLHAGKHEIPCTDCHMGAERGAAASLPSMGQCLACHMKPQGDPPSAMEQRVRELAAGDEPLRWIQVTRNPGHVYFSHRAHVALGGMKCARCHGDVTRWTRPPRRPEAKLRDMDACMSCHRQNGASNECATCHR